MPALDQRSDFFGRDCTEVDAVELPNLVIRPRPFVLVVVEVQVRESLLQRTDLLDTTCLDVLDDA